MSINPEARKINYVVLHQVKLSCFELSHFFLDVPFRFFSDCLSSFCLNYVLSGPFFFLETSGWEVWK